MRNSRWKLACGGADLPFPSDDLLKYIVSDASASRTSRDWPSRVLGMGYIGRPNAIGKPKTHVRRAGNPGRSRECSLLLLEGVYAYLSDNNDTLLFQSRMRGAVLAKQTTDTRKRAGEIHITCPDDEYNETHAKSPCEAGGVAGNHLRTFWASTRTWGQYTYHDV
jgi:hypothetical protein